MALLSALQALFADRSKYSVAPRGSHDGNWNLVLYHPVYGWAPTQPNADYGSFQDVLKTIPAEHKPLIRKADKLFAKHYAKGDVERRSVDKLTVCYFTDKKVEERFTVSSDDYVEAAAKARVAKTEHSPALRQLAEAVGIHLPY